MKQTNFRLPEEMDSKISELTDKFGLNKSEIFRQSITIYLNLLGEVDKLTNIHELEIQKPTISNVRSRDVYYLNIDKLGLSIAISSSSSGGIGPKKHDRIDVRGDVLGSYIMRTALIKLLVNDVKPNVAILNLSNEKDPTGKEVFEGIKKIGKIIGVENYILGHSEERVETNQTGVSVFTIGLKDSSQTTKVELEKGDKLLCLGKPRSGEEIIKKNSYFGLKNVEKINKMDNVKKLIPVGNSGIRKNLENYLEKKKTNYEINKGVNIDLDKPAGPSTSIIAITDKKIAANELQKITRDKQVIKLGKILN
ncbi:MAG: Ribbon-helix-helix protein, copG family [Candidatus Methanohalarchaeum thermophilum]|uniref:Ribbon-helix-helix protein, copG family n=1 Tax=Methanohalarchaeum thermophilum TaxID=1903181 RepID=A0A1Q6DUK5_METT1|nr:MAG: Ribbon-helix-helix protein, copG family [Candidatus Methanohalarchaeum thermophilum]